MKIEVWTMATDDDNGMTLRSFPSEADCTAAMWDYVARAPGGTESEIVNRLHELQDKFPGDVYAAWETVQPHMDTLTHDSMEIEIPDPAPAQGNATGSPAQKVWAVIRTIDGAMDLEPFLTKEAATNHGWEFIGEMLDTGEYEETFEEFKTDHDDDLMGCWETLTAGSSDTMQIYEIDWPGAAPVPAQKTAPKDYIHIGVTLEGGAVQDVFSDSGRDDVSVYVIDYDTEGEDDADLIAVPQGTGDEINARVHDHGLSKWGTPYFWQRLNQQLDKRDEGQEAEEIPSTGSKVVDDYLDEFMKT